MITISKQSGKQYSYTTEYVIDNLSELSELPTTAIPGSVAFCIEDSSVHMLGSDKEWHEVLQDIGGGGGSSGSAAIERVYLSEENHLIFVFADGSEKDAGEIQMETIDINVISDDAISSLFN